MLTDAKKLFSHQVPLQHTAEKVFPIAMLCIIHSVVITQAAWASVSVTVIRSTSNNGGRNNGYSSAILTGRGRRSTGGEGYKQFQEDHRGKYNFPGIVHAASALCSYSGALYSQMWTGKIEKKRERNERIERSR